MSVASAAAFAVVATGMSTTSASALTAITTTDHGQVWNINDAAAPGLDTGSVRNTSSNALLGYGGLRMDVADSRSPLNGILLRGFGLTFDGANSFSSSNSVTIDGVAVNRQVTLDQPNGSGRFFDTFTNTTKTTQTVSVAFGGELGYNTGTNQSAIAGTGNGDSAITSADGWASWYTPSTGTPGSASANGPSATVFGTPGLATSLDRMGDFQQGPFTKPLATSGDDANHPGFVNRLVIRPSQTVALAHFVVAGLSETRNAPDGTPASAAGTQVAAVQSKATRLAATPDFSGLSTPQICRIANYDLATVTTAGFDRARCATLAGDPLVGPGRGSVQAAAPVTTSTYDVVGKTITQELADMRAGKTNSSQIVRAYLDRIAAYDQGPLGLHSVLTVAPDAMQQAAVADKARKAGDTRPLLGIPILAKDIIDTKDMPTTGGSLVFDGYRPTKDAWQIAKLREAGAIILGKTNLSEFANSGYYSESGYGQVWNAFDQSKSSIGSSGGSGVAVASSFAAAAMGTQTGDSLWGPSGAASLTTLRGTDGMQSSQGVMPLTIVQDYVGFISQSPQDQALLMNATARGENPTDALDDVSNGHRPADWTSALSTESLRGKTIGVPESAFTDPFGTTGVSEALRARFADFEAAGATVKVITNAPSAPTRSYTGDTGYEGWRQWIADHPDNPYATAEQIITSQLKLPYNRRSSYTGTGPMSATDLQNFEDYRATYRSVLASWMDGQGVDAVLYPTELSDIHLNDSSASSFGRLDPQSSASGVPTVIFPAGTNANGSPIGFQLQGKAYQDDELLGMAYAFEHVADGRVLPTVTPALTYDASALPTPVETPEPLPTAPDLTAGKVVVSGSVTVGSTLTVSTGTWGPAPVSLAVQWLRDGKAIKGATSRSYRVTASSIGHNISAQVTGTKTGYSPATVTSAEKAVKGTLTGSVRPTITGTSTVGHKLGAVRGTWGPGTVRYTYQWYRNGVAIPSATSKYYTLTAKDRGTKVKVEVTGSKTDYISVRRVSTTRTIR